MDEETQAPAEEEQVVGVVSYCQVCDERTVHVDGVCRDHKIVRRRREVAPVVATAPRRRKQPPPPKSSAVGRVFAFLLVGAIIFGMGSVHVVRGSGGTHVCKKDGWSLSKTLVNIDELRVAKQPDPALVRALVKCQLPGEPFAKPAPK